MMDRDEDRKPDSEMVITPGGPRRRDQVVKVAPGEVVHRENEETYAAVSSDGLRERASALVPTTAMVLTPGGWRPRDKVHAIKPGERLVMQGERALLHDARGELRELVRIPPRPPGLPLMPRHVQRRLGPKPALGSGWIADAGWTNSSGNPISRFTTTWTVPPEPTTHNGQTIFLFNGIQNATMIYQPVLQWGPSAAGGGNRWSVASWYADGQNGTSFHSTLVDVHVGDVLVGVMTLTGQSAAGFSYNCEFVGIANTSLAIQDVGELTWANETLEAYGVLAASDYPAADLTTFSGIEIQTQSATTTSDPTMAWSAQNIVTDVGQHVNVVSNANPNGQVDIYYTDSPTNAFRPVYAQGDPGSGIGGYDLRSPADRAFAFDYDHSGKLDHLALYRPGTGTMWILRNQGGAFSPVYAQGDPGSGIGGYDLKSGLDRAFAFDYDHSGKLDHIALYRAGTGTMWILRNQGGAFSAVYAQGDPGSGIGGYDLRSPADQAFAFDADSSGKLDHIALYRPGTGTMWILRNQGGAFSPIYAQGDPGHGIGGYDLASPADQAFAFDYDGSGKLDHIALYRPATGTMWILKHSAGAFIPVYAQGDPGNGIGGYDLRSPSDRAFAFDYNKTGKLDHIALYRPGTGTMWILRNQGGAFSAVYHQGDPGRGIGGYDLRSSVDRALAFDYDHSGKTDHIALFRPGTGTMWILERV